MARFKYQARDASGEPVAGVVTAVSLEDAGQQLRAEGRFIVSLHATKEMASGSDTRPGGRIRRSDVIFMIQQLAVMLETGVAMSDALNCLVEQCPNPAFKYVLSDITRQVQAGTELSSAMGRYPKVFPIVVIALIRASEASGTMGITLDRINTYLTKEYATLRQARSALTYPMFMAGMAVTVTVFLLVFVLPYFAKVYDTRGASLPTPTRVLMITSNALTDYWYLWLSGLLALSGTLVLIGRTVSGRSAIDWLKLNAPLCGPLYRKLYLTRACRTMGTMIAAGVSVIEMVKIVRPVTNNVHYHELWEHVESRLMQGAQLSQPLSESSLIPRSVAQMVFSGEKAGQLARVMERVADFTETEFDVAVKTTTQMIEPIMIAVMGIMIGFLAISLLLPIFNVGRVMAS